MSLGFVNDDGAATVSDVWSLSQADRTWRQIVGDFQHQLPACGELSQLRRINVIGTSGSGKSTLARVLSSALGVPSYELDEVFWKPNWQPSSDRELLEDVRAITSRSEWILDGNYTRTVSVKWRRVQLVVWIDLPFVVTVARVVRRSIRRGLGRQEIWPGTGNHESLAQAFMSKKSVIWWAISTHRRRRAQYEALARSSEYSHVSFVRLRSRRDVQVFAARMRC